MAGEVPDRDPDCDGRARHPAGSPPRQHHASATLAADSADSLVRGFSPAGGRYAVCPAATPGRAMPRKILAACWLACAVVLNGAQAADYPAPTENDFLAR